VQDVGAEEFLKQLQEWLKDFKVFMLKLDSESERSGESLFNGLKYRRWLESCEKGKMPHISKMTVTPDTVPWNGELPHFSFENDVARKNFLSQVNNRLSQVNGSARISEQQKSHNIFAAICPNNAEELRKYFLHSVLSKYSTTANHEEIFKAEHPSVSFKEFSELTFNEGLQETPESMIPVILSELASCFNFGIQLDVLGYQKLFCISPPRRTKISRDYVKIAITKEEGEKFVFYPVTKKVVIGHKQVIEIPREGYGNKLPPKPPSPSHSASSANSHSSSKLHPQSPSNRPSSPSLRNPTSLHSLPLSPSVRATSSCPQSPPSSALHSSNITPPKQQSTANINPSSARSNSSPHSTHSNRSNSSHSSPYISTSPRTSTSNSSTRTSSPNNNSSPRTNSSASTTNSPAPTKSGHKTSNDHLYDDKNNGPQNKKQKKMKY